MSRTKESIYGELLEEAAILQEDTYALWDEVNDGSPPDELKEYVQRTMSQTDIVVQLYIELELFEEE